MAGMILIDRGKSGTCTRKIFMQVNFITFLLYATTVHKLHGGLFGTEPGVIRGEYCAGNGAI